MNEALFGKVDAVRSSLTIPGQPDGALTVLGIHGKDALSGAAAYVIDVVSSAVRSHARSGAATTSAPASTRWKAFSKDSLNKHFEKAWQRISKYNKTSICQASAILPHNRDAAFEK